MTPTGDRPRRCGWAAAAVLAAWATAFGLGPAVLVWAAHPLHAPRGSTMSGNPILEADPALNRSAAAALACLGTGVGLAGGAAALGAARPARVPAVAVACGVAVALLLAPAGPRPDARSAAAGAVAGLVLGLPLAGLHARVARPAGSPPAGG